MLATLVFDLKLTEDNQVQLLEVMQPTNAGFVGYKQATNLSMVNDQILPFYRELGSACDAFLCFQDARLNKNPWIQEVSVNPDGSVSCHMFQEPYIPSGTVTRENALTVSIKEDFSKQRLSSYSAFIYDTYYSPRKHPDHIAIVNDHPFLQLAMRDKRAFHYLFFPNLKDIMPEETVVAQDTPARMSKKIKREIRSANFVLKLPCSARGEGIVLANRNNLEEILEILYAKRENRGLVRRKINEKPALKGAFNHKSAVTMNWGGHHGPIVVQARKASKPIKHPDGQIYDGTMRVAVTIWQEGATIKFKLHDGYWKLPVQPISSQNAIDIVSASPSKKPCLPVSSTDLKIVSRQLGEYLPAAMADIWYYDYSSLFQARTAKLTREEVYKTLSLISHIPPGDEISIPEDKMHKLAKLNIALGNPNTADLLYPVGKHRGKKNAYEKKLELITEILISKTPHSRLPNPTPPH